MFPKAPPVYKPGSNSPQGAAPPVYRPHQTNPVSVQLKSAGRSMETRTAPPVYRLQQNNASAQPKSAFPAHPLPVRVPSVSYAAPAAQLQHDVKVVNRTGNIFPQRMSHGAGNAPSGVLQPKPYPIPGVVTAPNFGSPRPAPAVVQPFQRNNVPLTAPVFQPNLSVLQLSKKGRGGKKDDEEKKKIFTRILHPDQLKRKNIGIKSVRRGDSSLRRNLPSQFTPFGNHTSDMSGLFSFMRKYGGAGFMGLHTSPTGPLTRAKVVRSVLSKMKEDRVTRSSRGPKFAIVAIDSSRLNNNSVFDFNSQQTRRNFVGSYPNFSGMYDRHADEGVVAISDNIPRSAVIGLRAFRDVPTEEELEALLDELMAEAELDEHETVKKPTFRKDFDPDGDGGGRDAGIVV